MHKYRLKFSKHDFPIRLGNMSPLKKLAVRGMVWTIAGYGASQILRLGSNLILTRLLFPELFGLMTLVNIFITGLHLFSDIGVGPSIIQNKRGDDPVFLNTAWTLQVIRSFGIWLCCILLAWPVANFYDMPQLLWLIPLVGLNTIINGFNSTALYTLNRHMAIAQLAIFELGADHQPCSHACLGLVQPEHLGSCGWRTYLSSGSNDMDSSVDSWNI